MALALVGALTAIYVNSTTASINEIEERFIQFIQDEKKSYFSQSEYSFRLGVFA